MKYSRDTFSAGNPAEGVHVTMASLVLKVTVIFPGAGAEMYKKHKHRGVGR